MTESPEPNGGFEPRGTLAIVSIFGALVVVGWLLLFFGLFVPRGTQ
jgi:hypothetical protein